MLTAELWHLKQTNKEWTVNGNRYSHKAFLLRVMDN